MGGSSATRAGGAATPAAGTLSAGAPFSALLGSTTFPLTGLRGMVSEKSFPSMWAWKFVRLGLPNATVPPATTSGGGGKPDSSAGLSPAWRQHRRHGLLADGVE